VRRRRIARTKRPEPITRGHILFGGPSQSQPIPPMDEATAAFAREITAALTSPLTSDELAAADIEVARWDRATALLDAFVAAAKTGSIDLAMVEGEPGRSHFFVEAWVPRTKAWLRVAELLLGDERSDSDDPLGAN
jgi:hypothetical protein